MLRHKSIKKNGDTRYANKTACKKCPYRNRSITGKGQRKEIDFNKDTLEKKRSGGKGTARRVQMAHQREGKKRDTTTGKRKW